MTSEVVLNAIAGDVEQIWRHGGKFVFTAVIAIIALGSAFCSARFHPIALSSFWLKTVVIGTAQAVTAGLAALFGSQFVLRACGVQPWSWQLSGWPSVAAALVAIAVSYWVVVRAVRLVARERKEPVPSIWRRFTLSQMLAAQFVLAVIVGGWMMSSAGRIAGEQNQLERKQLERRVRQFQPKLAAAGCHVQHYGENLSVTIWSPDADDNHLELVAELGHVNHLNVAAEFITDRGLEALASINELENIRLELRGSHGVTPQGVHALTRLPKLHTLDLIDRKATDETVRLLASGGCPEKLVLRISSLTDASLAHLAGAKRLKHLAIYSANSQFTAEGLTNFESSRPEVKLDIIGRPAGWEPKNEATH